MPSPATNLSTDFQNYLSNLERTRQVMENLLGQQLINLADIEQVYSGLYLNLFTAFESLLEDLFFGLLSGNITSSNPAIVSIGGCGTITRDVLLIGKKYLEWLPYERTEERAKVFFQDGLPFSLLSEKNVPLIQKNNYKDKLAKHILVRNALAHKSDYANQKFLQEVIANIPLPPSERTPIGYLRSQFRSNPAQTRYELVTQEIIVMSSLLCQ